MATSSIRSETSGCSRRQSSVLPKTKALAAPRVEERLHAKVIARAEQPLPFSIPDREGEIAEQMLDATDVPLAVGPQDQLDVGRAHPGHRSGPRRACRRDRRGRRCAHPR